jgi:hypothetical protein
VSGWDDLDDVTPRISNEDAERLLSGATGIDGAPELADLNTVVNALRGPAEPAELTGLLPALAAFGAAVVTAQSAPPTARTRPMFKKLLTGKALATIGVVTLASAGAAAAAGVVPSPFSAPRPSVATSVHGTDEEATDDTAADDTIADDTVADTTPTTDATDATDPITTDGDDASEGTDGQGPDVNGPAKFGLCTAYAARTKHDDETPTTEAVTEVAEPDSDSEDGDLPVPFQNLTDAAEAAGQTVAEFCADAVPGGSAEAPGHSGDNPSASAPGQSGDNPGQNKGKSGEDHGRPDTTHP